MGTNYGIILVLSDLVGHDRLASGDLASVDYPHNSPKVSRTGLVPQYSIDAMTQCGGEKQEAT